MTPIQSFKHDAFISYRHEDNRERDESNKTWIENFHERLENRLNFILGEKPSIWRDPKMPGNVDVREHLKEKIKETILLISVLSPGYLRSDWCTGELQKFCRLAEESDGLTINGKFRIFKVVRTLLNGRIPHQFENLKGYDFFEKDPMTDQPIEFGQEIGNNKDPKYWNKLYDLAWDIKQVLDSIKAPPPPPKNPFEEENVPVNISAPKSKGTIYLAETTYDRMNDRDNIKRELQERGYEILPDKVLPYVSPHYEEAVRENLGRSKLSIHLIGENYGIIPEGPVKRSIVSLQNDLAAQRRRSDPKFTRLIWMPEDLAPKDPEQGDFIELLRTRADLQAGAELLRTSLEELKSVINVRLSTNGHRKPPPSPGKKIYLICDKRDVNQIIPINDYLSRRGYKIRLPLIDDEGVDDSQAIEIHNDNLLQCDAVLIYFGSANQVWFNYKLRDLEKIAGLERIADRDRVKPLLASAIYVAGPPTDFKRLFRTNDSVLIQNFEKFDPSLLDEFLAQIESPGSADNDNGRGPAADSTEGVNDED
ncbi:MAG TPA: TIR domain-containing protein [Pyrinomonadaceae bacterium]|nr:TIR domain-containing protein [Pyrinomonadaceae bacterium]